MSFSPHFFLLQFFDNRSDSSKNWIQNFENRIRCKTCLDPQHWSNEVFFPVFRSLPPKKRKTKIKVKVKSLKKKLKAKKRRKRHLSRKQHQRGVCSCIPVSASPSTPTISSSSRPFSRISWVSGVIIRVGPIYGRRIELFIVLPDTRYPAKIKTDIQFVILQLSGRTERFFFSRKITKIERN